MISLSRIYSKSVPYEASIPQKQELKKQLPLQLPDK